MGAHVVTLAAIDPNLLFVGAVVGGFVAGVFHGLGLTAFAVGVGFCTAGFIIGRNVESITTEDAGGFWPTLFLVVIAFGLGGAGSEFGSWLKERWT